MFHCNCNNMPQITDAFNKFLVADRIFPIAVRFSNRLCIGPRDLDVILACMGFCKKIYCVLDMGLWYFSLAFMGNFLTAHQSHKTTAQSAGLLKRCLKT